MATERTTRKIIPDHIPQLPLYIPGKSIEQVEQEIGRTAIKLASNENPLGPSPRVVEVIRSFAHQVNRYPDAAGTALRGKLASGLGVDADNIVLGNGSTELIQLSTRLFLSQGGCGLTSAGTFVMFPATVAALGEQCLRVPQRDYAYDLDAIADAFPGDCRVIYIANPNNPSGSLVRAAELDRFLARIPDDIPVILDEAYFEYVDDPSYTNSLDYVRQGRPVLVLRTFSKVYGLAGMRIGYGIARPDIIDALNRLRSPFNYSALALAAAEAALDDQDHVRRSQEWNREGLTWLTAELRSLGAMVAPSSTNFLYVETGYEPAAVAAWLLGQGVIVRPLAFMEMPRGLRVTIGTEEENRRLVELLVRIDDAGLPRLDAA